MSDKVLVPGVGTFTRHGATWMRVQGDSLVRPQEQMQAALDALARTEALVEAVDGLSKTAPPDDWEYYSPGWGWKEYMPADGESKESAVEAPDESKSDDCHYHGYQVGRWAVIKELRAALAAYQEARAHRA